MDNLCKLHTHTHILLTKCQGVIIGKLKNQKQSKEKKTLHQNVIERVEKNSNLKHSVRKFEANRIRLEDLSSNFVFYSNRRYMKPEKKANSLSAFLDFFPI